MKRPWKKLSSSSLKRSEPSDTFSQNVHGVQHLESYKGIAKKIEKDWAEYRNRDNFPFQLQEGQWVYKALPARTVSLSCVRERELSLMCQSL